mgnify:FL=1|tara:strand:- start:5406 stop:5765 length:360 start_codon:yes stop_codon:yes gene_type:complete
MIIEKGDISNYVFNDENNEPKYAFLVNDLINKQIKQKNKHSLNYELERQYENLSDLGIPGGLVLDNYDTLDMIKKGGCNNIKTLDSDVINTQLFDKLFEKVAKIKSKFSNNKTLKKPRK